MSELTFGEWLKRQRMGKGLTREQFADQIGCAIITLRKIESEERRASEQIVLRIADIFNLPSAERSNLLKFARGDWTKAPTERPIEIPRPSADTRNNLRIPLSSLIGRAQEIVAVCEYLNTPDTRLVTLLGAPGIGKTRLSIAAARQLLEEFRDGVFFVELAPLEESSLVALTIAQTIGFAETPDTTPTERIRDGIGDKKMLIVLDNIEHVLDVIATLASDLLSTCPHLKILTTSREPIRCHGEWLYPVPVLIRPSEEELSSLSVEASMQFTALKLFAERARAVQPDFALTCDNLQIVTTICTRLDGLPLAIELFAARVHTLSVDDLLAQMTYAFVLSADGMRAVPARQKTLQNAIGWSYRLLPENEKTLYRRLAVFAGDWTLDTAQAVCADQDLSAGDIPHVLTQLVEKSLVVEEEAGGQRRYSMLETIRQYAHDKLLESHEIESTSNRHLAYFLKLAEEIEPTLHGPAQAASLDHMEAEMDNFRTALRWGLLHKPESGVLLTGALWLFWFMHSHFIEGKQWYEEALAVSDQVSKYAQMRLFIGVASSAMGRNNGGLVQSSSEQSLALARELNDTWGISMSLHHLGPILAAQGDHAQAQVLLEEGLEVSRRAGHWAVLLYILDDIGLLALHQKNYHQAELYFNAMSDLSQQHEEKWVYGHAISCLSELAYSQNQYEKAMELIRESLRFAIETGNTRLIAVNLNSAGTVFNRLGEPEKAARLFGATNTLAKSIDLFFNSMAAELKTIYPQLGEDKFTSLYAEGESLSAEKAIALAMNDE